MSAFRFFYAAAALGCGLTAYATAPATLTPAGLVPSSLPGTASGKLAALLPSSGQAAQVMKLESRLTIVNLQRRVLQSGGSPDALRLIMASLAKGERPTYDARLNISKEEFGKYLAFQPVLSYTGKVIKLAVVRDSNRVTFIDTDTNGLLRGLSFDMRSGELHVPEGFNFQALSVVPSTAPDRLIDIRSGFQWNLLAYSAQAQSGVRGQVSLYQLGDGQMVLSYRRTSSLIHSVFNNNASEIILKYAR